MIFTEGTVLMHPSGKNVSREERIRQVTNRNSDVNDFASYIPIGYPQDKLKKWEQQGVEIMYLTSRRKKDEVRNIQQVLDKYGFPRGRLYSRSRKEKYKDIAERVIPDVLIEDNCESIGGSAEMTYFHLSSNKKKKIISIPVPEFGGIDHLPDSPTALTSWGLNEN